MRRGVTVTFIAVALIALIFGPGRLQSPISNLLREAWGRKSTGITVSELPELELLQCFDAFVETLPPLPDVQIQSSDGYFIQRMTGAAYPRILIRSNSTNIILNASEAPRPSGATLLATMNCGSTHLELISLD